MNGSAKYQGVRLGTVTRNTTKSRNRARTMLIYGAILTLVVLFFVRVSLASNDPERKAIQEVLDQQIAAWNRGDIDGFMAGYWKSPDMVYIGNEKIVRGWQALLEVYQRGFPPQGTAQMGKLELPDEEIIFMDKNSAIVWGKFVVTTDDGKKRGGLYTLVMHKTPEGWRTVYDRTSSSAQ